MSCTWLCQKDRAKCMNSLLRKAACPSGQLGKNGKKKKCMYFFSLCFFMRVLSLCNLLLIIIFYPQIKTLINFDVMHLALSRKQSKMHEFNTKKKQHVLQANWAKMEKKNACIFSPLFFYESFILCNLLLIIAFYFQIKTLINFCQLNYNPFNSPTF